MIGTTTLAVIAAAFVGMLAIQKIRAVRQQGPLRIVFEGSASGLRKGGSVNFDGVQIGEIKSLTLDNPRKVVAFVMVDNSAPIRKDTVVGLEFQGLTGIAAISLTGGAPGVLHGNRTYLLQDDDGQIIDAHSISAGLDYPGIGPEHAWLHDVKRVEYVSITDREALAAFQLCSRQEGIIPALEPAHALAHVAKIAPTLPRDHLMVMNMCGRGDKDIFAVAEHFGVKL